MEPYRERPGETLIEKCARIKAELQAKQRRKLAPVSANDNEPKPVSYYWDTY